MHKTAIIVPCYNEAKRLNSFAFIESIQANDSFNFYFVNDGSTDDTLVSLNRLSSDHPSRIFVIDKKNNEGKAAAVRDAVLLINSKNYYDYTGYADADLSTSLSQCKILIDTLIATNSICVFGSRIKKLGSEIKRSSFRHICGRMLATIIDNRYQLGIYDTQCGAKFFSIAAFASVCKDPFKTKWLFDIEIFIRLLKTNKKDIIEFPLQQWSDPGHSKLGATDFPRIAKEVYLLFKHYPKTNDRSSV